MFQGHGHIYERFLKDDNTDGIVVPYFTSGVGGRSLYACDTPLEPDSVNCYDGNYGTMIVNASATGVTFEFWSITGGATLIDTYTITP